MRYDSTETEKQLNPPVAMIYTTYLGQYPEGDMMGNRIVWFTGLSGAGKTTIAMAVADRFGCEVLDGDTIRDFFANRDFSREGRERHLLGIAKMAKMMSKHTDVLCSFITPYEDVREKILEILPDDAVMVHVSTSLEVCEDRDVKGLYARARTGERRVRLWMTW